MIYVVSGSRTITDVKAIERILSYHISSKDVVRVGDANGVDEVAQDYAHRYFNDVTVFPAGWLKHGKAAGPIRNAQMLEGADIDALIAIWDGKSRGTKHAIKTALSRGIETHVYFLTGEQE